MRSEGKLLSKIKNNCKYTLALGIIGLLFIWLPALFENFLSKTLPEFYFDIFLVFHLVILIAILASANTLYEIRRFKKGNMEEREENRLEP